MAMLSLKRCHGGDTFNPLGQLPALRLLANRHGTQGWRGALPNLPFGGVILLVANKGLV